MASTRDYRLEHEIFENGEKIIQLGLRTVKLEIFEEVQTSKFKKLEARVKKLEALIDEMVACQPSDPRGDLARAEKSFDEGAGKRKRTQREEKD